MLIQSIDSPSSHLAFFSPWGILSFSMLSSFLFFSLIEELRVGVSKGRLIQSVIDTVSDRPLEPILFRAPLANIVCGNIVLDLPPFNLLLSSLFIHSTSIIQVASAWNLRLMSCVPWKSYSKTYPSRRLTAMIIFTFRASPAFDRCLISFWLNTPRSGWNGLLTNLLLGFGCFKSSSHKPLFYRALHSQLYNNSHQSPLSKVSFYTLVQNRLLWWGWDIIHTNAC